MEKLNTNNLLYQELFKKDNIFEKNISYNKKLFIVDTYYETNKNQLYNEELDNNNNIFNIYDKNISYSNTLPIDFTPVNEIEKYTIYNNLSYEEIVNKEKILYEKWNNEKLDFLKLKKNLFEKIKTYCLELKCNIKVNVINEMINKLKLIYMENKDIEFLDLIENTIKKYLDSVIKYTPDQYQENNKMKFDMSCILLNIIYKINFELINYNNKEIITSLLDFFNNL